MSMGRTTDWAKGRGPYMDLFSRPREQFWLASNRRPRTTAFRWVQRPTLLWALRVCRRVIGTNPGYPGPLFYWYFHIHTHAVAFPNFPSKFFLALQSFCCRLLVVLLSYDSRSTLTQLDRTKKFGRVLKKNIIPINFDSWTYTKNIIPSRPFLSSSRKKSISGTHSILT